jgi:hypothetical protein
MRTEKGFRRSPPWVKHGGRPMLWARLRMTAVAAAARMMHARQRRLQKHCEKHLDCFMNTLYYGDMQVDMNTL